MELSPNHILNDRFRIIRLLGQGGMGAVYYAYDPVLDRYVAIKQLQPSPIPGDQAGEQARKQFLREARSLAGLHHPNLPRVTDYFVDGGLHYLVMDYIEGRSLQEIVQANQGGVDEDQVLEWADQLLGALDYIHQHSLVHRDVKPANIRRTSDGRLFLVDFGLVKTYDANNPKTLTMFHSLGTLEYAPPEQFDPLAHTDQRSDVYSLGATLYHMLTGAIPIAVTRRISDPEAFHTLRQANASVSPEVERVILRAMELERAKRFASAADMRAALQLIRQARAVEPMHTASLAAEPAAGGIPPERSRRRRLAAVLTIPILLAAVGLMGLAVAQSNLPVVGPAATPSATSGMTPGRASTSTATPASEPTPTLTATPASPTASPSLTLTTTRSLTPSILATLPTTSAPRPTRVNTGGNPPQSQPTPVVGTTPNGNPTPRSQNTPPGQVKPKNTPPGKSRAPTSSGGGSGNQTPK